MPIDYRRGIAWALASVVASAGFVIPWKLASALGSPATNTLILLSAGAVFTTLLTIIQRKALPRFTRFDLIIAMALALCTLVGNLSSANAIAVLSPAVFTVLQRSELIVVALLAWPIIGERIDRRFWVGAAVALGGLMLIQNPFAEHDPRSAGAAWAGVSVISFALMTVITRKVVHQIDVVSVNALRLWFSLACWFAWCGLPSDLIGISMPQILYIGLAGFFGPFMARLCLMNSAKFIEARLTTLVTLAAPPLTLIVAYILLSDLPSTREIQGGILMLTGISIPVISMVLQANQVRKS